MNLIEILKSVVQGIVQGITEWLPISSTGHILLLDAVWPMNVSTDFFDVFKVLIQLGSILAVLVLYFHKLNPLSPKKTVEQKRDTWSLWAKVLIASVPAAVVGLAIDDWVDTVLSTPVVIAATLLIYGVLFIWLENRNKTPRIHQFDEMDYKTALFIGMFQMLALIPGTSRSGSTILGAVLLGCSRYIAAEFSFFMAIPAMFGASALKLLKYVLEHQGLTFTLEEWVILAVGTVVSFVVSLLVIRFLMNYIKKHDFKPFGYYRIALAAVILLVLWLAPAVFQGVTA